MKYIRLIVSVLICEAAGIIGSFFTAGSVTSWYAFLVRPAFAPPNWLFGPVWTILYFMMGISLYLMWDHDKLFFWIQLFLNTMWSIIFFGLKQPLIAFIEIILLWIFILLTIIKFYRVKREAAYLLIPYLLWVTFAAALNLGIVLLN